MTFEGKLKSFLLISNQDAQAAFEAVKLEFEPLIGVMFLLGLIVTYCVEGNVFSPLKKLILAYVLLFSFPSIHKGGVDLSFDVADRILEQLGPGNKLLESVLDPQLVKTGLVAFQMTSGLKEKEVPEGISGLWEHISRSIENTKNLGQKALGLPFNFIFLLLVKLFIAISFIALKIVYSFSYYATTALLIIPILLMFIPKFESSLFGAIKGSIFCMVFPVVLVLFLALTGTFLSNSTGDSLLGSSVEGLALVLICSIVLIFSPYVTWGLLGAMGISGAMAKVGGIAGTVASAGLAPVKYKIAKNKLEKEFGKAQTQRELNNTSKGDFGDRPDQKFIKEWNQSRFNRSQQGRERPNSPQTQDPRDMNVLTGNLDNQRPGDLKHDSPERGFPLKTGERVHKDQKNLDSRKPAQNESRAKDAAMIERIFQNEPGVQRKKREKIEEVRPIMRPGRKKAQEDKGAKREPAVTQDLSGVKKIVKRRPINENRPK